MPLCYRIPVEAGERGATKESGWRDKFAEVAVFRLWGIGVVADLSGLPEMAAAVSGHVRHAGAQGHLEPLEIPRSLGAGLVEAVGS